MPLSSHRTLLLQQRMQPKFIFALNSERNIRMLRYKLRFTRRQVNNQFLLSLSDWCSTRRDILLLQLICRFHVFRVQRSYSVYQRCKRKWLFEILFLFCQNELVQKFSSDLFHQEAISTPKNPCSVEFFLDILCTSTRDPCLKILVDYQFSKYSDIRVQQQQMCHVKSYISFPYSSKKWDYNAEVSSFELTDCQN